MQPEFQALKCCHIYLILLQVSERRARRGQKNEEDARRNHDMIIKNHVRSLSSEEIYQWLC